jgi:hypothetical protein
MTFSRSVPPNGIAIAVISIFDKLVYWVLNVATTRHVGKTGSIIGSGCQTLIQALLSLFPEEFLSLLRKLFHYFFD